MATFNITAPDGRKYRVTGENAEGALAALRKMQASEAAQVQPDYSRHPSGREWSPLEEMIIGDPKTTASPGAGRGSWVDPVMQGLVPFADEIAGGLAGAVDSFRGNVLGEEGRSFPGGYNRIRNRVNADYEAFKERHPYASIALEAAGSIPGSVALPLGAAARGAGLLEKTARGAAAGGLMGTAYGAGHGENFEDRAYNAAATGALGFGVGGAFPNVGRMVGKGLKVVANRNRPAPAPGIDPAQRVADAETFGIPLTQGQRTGNLVQTAEEEALRHASRGQGPANTMQEFARRQSDAAATARQGMQDQFAGTGAPINTADEAGEAATGAIRGRAADLRKESQRQYAKAEAADPVIRADHVRQVKEDFVKRLVATNFPFDDKLHPTAFKALQEIDRLAAIPDVGGSSIQGMSLKGIETVRRRMLVTKGTNPDDMRAMKLVRDTFDEWLDDAVDRKLFDGDPTGLVALKEARASWSKYRALTNPKTGDDAGRIVSKMVKNDVTGQEVGNWLFGSSIINPPATTVRVARRLKKELGTDNDAWSAIRQAAWIRMTKGKDGQELGPQALASAIHGFVDGRGKALARELFAPEELSLMRKFANVQRTLVPDPRATNPSKSSYGLARALQPIVTGLASALGFQSGGVVGAIGAAAGVPAVRSIIGNAAARRATNPKLLQPIFTNAEEVSAAGFEAAGRTSLPAIAERRPLEITVPVGGHLQPSVP